MNCYTALTPQRATLGVGTPSRFEGELLVVTAACQRSRGTMSDPFWVSASAVRMGGGAELWRPVGCFAKL